MAFLHHKFTRKALLALILFWSVISFWYLNPLFIARLVVVVLSAFGLFFILAEVAPIFLLILLSFTSSYALFGFLFQLNISTWQIMLSILIIFGFLFTYVEQKIGILGDKRLIYLILFSLIILEVFLAISYFMINPLSQSLIIASISYLFSGFCFTILAKREEMKFSTYVIMSVIVLGAIFLSSI